MSGYTLIDTYELDLDDLDVDTNFNIFRPETLILRVGKKPRLNVFRWCYTDRKSYNLTGRGPLNRSRFVNIQSLSNNRITLARRAIKALISNEITYTHSKYIGLVFDDIDTLGLEIKLNHKNAGKALYQQYTALLLDRIHQSKIAGAGESRATALFKQNALKALLAFANRVSKATVDTWAPKIRQRNKERNLPQIRRPSNDMARMFSLHLRYFIAIADHLITDKPAPIIVQIEEEFGHPDLVYYGWKSHSYNQFNSKKGVDWRPFAYTREGVLTTWQAVIAAARTQGVDLRQMPNYRAEYSVYDNVARRFRNRGGSLAEGSKRKMANVAVRHFSHLLLGVTGGNLEHLMHIDFGTERLLKRIDTVRVLSLKPRAGYRVEPLKFHANFLPIWRKFMALREWMIKYADESHLRVAVGIHTLHRSGKSLTPLTGDILNNQRNFILPPDVPWVTPKEWRKFKSTEMLDASNGNIELVARLMGHSVNTSRNHYAFKNSEDAATELHTFFNAFNASARQRAGQGTPARVIEIGAKTTTGRCTAQASDDPALIKGIDGTAPGPRCGAPLTCFFCEHYGLHADDHDIKRILSAQQFIQLQSSSVSRNMDEHYQKFAPIFERINVIIEEFSARDERCKGIVDRAREAVERGNLDSYWSNKISALIDAKEAV